MKTTVLFLTGILLISVLACTPDPDPGNSAEGDVVYTCPMHPSVVSDKPGACPVCGMALVKRSEMQEATPDELGALAAVSLSPTQRVLANIRTEPVRIATLTSAITATGIVEPAGPRRSTIAARFGGRLERLWVTSIGENVRKGQPLFQLYSPDLISAQQEFLLALTSPSDAGARLSSSARERLIVHFGMTESQVEELARTGDPRSSLTFHAPLAGTVLAKSLVEGQYVEEGMPLYDLIDLSLVWAFLEVYEKDLYRVRTGQAVRIESSLLSRGSTRGTVTLIEPEVSTVTRTVRVRADIPNPGLELRPGVFLTAHLEIQLAPTLVVPRSAVLSLGTREVVWVEIRRNTFEPRMVQVGSGDGTHVQILRGLQEGEMVATTGGYLIDSESTLQGPASVPTTSTQQSHELHSPAAGAELIDLLVKGSYAPERIVLRLGRTAHLRIYRDEKSSCTEEIVFPAFGRRVTLAAFDTTHVVLTPTERGTFSFSCGMDMIHGTIVVQ
jgi:Cu(I)/Ag(I) efflux system membrane fusion protein